MTENCRQPIHTEPKSDSPRTPGTAVASLVLGILSVFGFALLLLPTILAIVLGHTSRAKIRRDPRLSGEGVALAGLILGYLSIVIAVVVPVLLAAMAVPAFQQVRSTALERMLQNDARQISSAAQQYMFEHGTTRVEVSINPETGEVAGDLADYLVRVSEGTVMETPVIVAGEPIRLRQTKLHREAYVFDDLGQMLYNPRTGERR